jgi:tetratricopeptide (TPR) repeat protein
MTQPITTSGRQNPPSAPPRAEVGELAALMNTGRYAEVERRAGTLLDRYPNLGLVWKMYGAALVLQGKEALHALRKANQLLPDDAETHFYLGNALHDHGDLAGAVASHRRALEITPGLAEAHDSLGSALQDLGQLNEAAASHRRAIEIKPELAEAHNNLGNALLELNQIDTAVMSYRRALAIRPNYAEAHGNLGNALRDLGQPQEALASYRRMLEIRPDSAEAHNNLGNALLSLGQLEDAAASYRRALAIRPRSAGALANLGNVLRGLGQPQEAALSCRRALEMEPDFVEAHRYLGNAKFDLGQFDEAAASYGRALALKPDFAEVHTALSVVLRQTGRAAEAEASCRRALEIAPNSAEALAFLGEIHADRGQFSEAEDLFKRALSIDPDLPEGWAGIARYRKMGDGDAPWLAAAQRLVGKRLPMQHEINMRYAIGKYFDDVKDFEQAFASYRLANELTKRYGVSYDRERVARRVDRITAAYDRNWLRQLRPEANPSERPVFIVGMPRAGTTLAEQILASHPAVFGAGELRFWHTASADYESSSRRNGLGGAAGSEAGDAAVISGLSDQYLRQLDGLSADALRVVDKMPANIMNLGLIHAALPNARIIHMQRNPIDTCLSIYFQVFSTTHSYANDLEHLAHYYTQYLRVMEHWRSTLPEGAILDVPYEGLVEDSEVWSRRMVQFVGLPWDPRCLDFHQTNRTVLTASNWQVRQKISKLSVGRWRSYEKFVGPLRHLMESGPYA